MADNVDNSLMLEHLKRIHATLERMDRRIEELTIRQTETHAAVLGLRRDQVNDARYLRICRCNSTPSALVWIA